MPLSLAFSNVNLSRPITEKENSSGGLTCQRKKNFFFLKKYFTKNQKRALIIPVMSDWPPKGYVFKSNPKSYHNDPAQQHGSIAEDKLRKETNSAIKNRKSKKNHE